MRLRRRTWLPWTLGAVLAHGCCHGVQERTDLLLCELATRPVDVAASTAVPDTPRTPSTTPEPALPGRTLTERLQIPSELPGADAPAIRLPPSTAPRQEREAALGKLFPAPPPIGPDIEAVPGPGGKPLTLADLQHLATTNSPVLRQAAAQLEAARGAAVQAGLYPNPVVGYEGDTMGQGGTAGLQGGFVEQTIRTGGKLKLAQAAAEMDVKNAELALRRSQADLAAQVRAGYFAVLVARENVRITHALARFADEVYRIQVDQVKGEQAAAYEPLQVRVLATQARGALAQARNRYVAAWKQLAATLGLPGMPLTQLAGHADAPVPQYVYDKLLAQVLSTHTDVLTAQNTAQRARYQLRLAQVTPLPDVDVRFMMQKDYTTPPFLVANSLVVGMQLPVWNRNQGGITQAQADLLRAVEESHRVRSDLTSRLAEAFQRYESSRLLLAYYRNHILPDQVRAYRGVYERHQQEPTDVSFPDVVSAQQTLASVLTTYVAMLGDVWSAVAELSGLLQTEDLYLAADVPVADAVSVLDQLCPLPCGHPCSPAADPRLRQGDGTWPPAAPVLPR